MKTRDLNGIVSRTDSFRVDPRSIKVVDGFNPRSFFDIQSLNELKESIINKGVINALKVRKNINDEIVLVDGERRLRATMMAISEGHNIVSIPVTFTDGNDVDLLVTSLLTNEGVRLSPIEEANAYKRLLNFGLSISDIAKETSKTYQFVQYRLELLNGSKEIQEAILNKEVTQQQALKIIKESDGSIQKQKEILNIEKTKKELKLKSWEDQVKKIAVCEKSELSLNEELNELVKIAEKLGFTKAAQYIGSKIK